MSFAGSKLLGVRVDRVSTSAEHTLGEVVVQNDGSVYRYVLAGEAIAAYEPVDWVAAYTASVTDATDLIMGVAQLAIASGSYGWVLEHGVGVILMTASAAATDIGRLSAAGGLGNVPPADHEGLRGQTYAAEAATPAGVACYLF